MGFRKIIQYIHLWLGFTSGILLFTVAVTGCILAFEDEIRNITQHDLLNVSIEDKPRISCQQILQAIREYNPTAKLNQIRIYGDASKAIQCYTRDKKIIAVNPYQGKILGYRDTERDVLSVILSFHRTLLLGKTGERIILCNVCIFLVMLISGIILWLPPRLKQLRKNLILKGGLAPKKRNYEWHRMLGLYAWIPLMLIAITGIAMATGGNKEPKVKSSFITISHDQGIYDKVMSKIKHSEPIDVLRVTFPKDSVDVITIGIRYQTRGLRKQNNFLFDQYTGKLIKTEVYQQKSFGQRFFGSNYEIHTGRIFGIPGKLIMFLAGLVGASLPVTGFLIWWSKKKK
ncbi:PepSY-associated TM helix domain-containing protein [Chryseosolibacter indicus]|uniref:PepSY domain-containing protein n=1 Tax=Chryseosolibacter indicus TaxID=2782351 RepID=A0ABS5VPX2_9BACT|nr:PepSY-associated TM helix domain-containing protein [Chryseosolibacter indicus]MBT1702847.1 PepSY domain-containing protein [Chryseosolibacter indicus]